MTKDEKSTGYIEEEKVIQSVGYREFAFGKVYSSLNDIGLFSDKNQKNMITYENTFPMKK